MVLDVATKADQRYNNTNEKVVILLHGVTGESTDYYVYEMAQHCTKQGFNVVMVNHYGMAGVTNMRLMDFTK